jgi:hypothetical protein
MPEPVDPNHLLLIGAGPGVGADVVRPSAARASAAHSSPAAKRSTSSPLNSGGLEIEAIGADIEALAVEPEDALDELLDPEHLGARAATPAVPQVDSSR